MAAIINTNIGSLNAQRNLTTSQTAMSTAMQRLSSGLRINSAKDDAAGLAISERFTTQIRGLNQATRNANDGISLSQTGEGALAEMTTNLQRIRELAVQSANSTNSASDRAALDQEVKQRLAEIDRVATQTNFNGQRILDGTFGEALFQVGANVGEAIKVGLSTSMRTNAVGTLAKATSTDLDAVFGNPSGVAGTFTTSASLAEIPGNDGEDGSKFVLSVDGIEILNKTQTTTASTGAFTSTTAPAAAAANETYAITLNIGSESIDLARIVSEAAGDTFGTSTIDAQVKANQDALKAAGYTVTGTATAGFTITRADGQAFTVTEANDYDTPGTDFASLTSTPLDSSVGTAYTVTAADLDGAIASKRNALEAAGISVSGTATAGDLKFIRSDGRAFDIVLTNTGATPGGWGTTSPNNVFGDADTGTAFSKGTITINNDKPVSLAAGDFTIRVGDAKQKEYAITGSFDTLQDVADAITSTVPGMTALVNSAGKLELFASDDITLSGDATESGGDLTFTSLNNAAGGDLRNVSVATVDQANDAILRVDAALTAVSTLRSTFGAIQNRFESTIANLGSTAENLSASRSRILDADFAAETAALSRAQILQQAGTAMIAQANQIPQGVLALLR